MKLRISSSLLFALSLSLANGEDISKPWTSVAFRVQHADMAAAVAIEGSESLTKVKLSLIGTSMEVPAKELEDIDQPLLDSAQLLFGEDWYGEWKEGEKATPHFIVEMSYGTKSEFGNLPTVKFLFHSGKYQERVTSVQKTTNVWEEFTKLPGEEAVLTGTATRAGGGKEAPEMRSK